MSLSRLLGVAVVLSAWGMLSGSAEAGSMPWRPCGPGYINAFFLQGCAGADFRPACQQHDNCYQSCSSRRDCDEQFYTGMCEACQCSRHPHVCHMTAWIYYKGTRIFGRLYRD